MYWTFTVYQELSLCLYIYRYNIQNKHKKYINIHIGNSTLVKTRVQEPEDRRAQNDSLLVGNDKK